MEKEFSVNLWRTHPDLENDDCYTGESFETLEEAIACFFHLEGTFDMVYYSDCPFVEMDGPGIHGVMELPGVAKRARKAAAMDDAAGRSEYAMQQGMGLGVHAYNEAMGGDSEEAPPSEPYEGSYQEWQRDQEREAER